MKKRMTMFLSIALLYALLAGCGTTSREQDRKVEKLEDALDDAEDRLENRFGIDD
ncbi:MAG: hypothetical protein Q4P20_02555 [Eubacteriales bacterium]|nr:hypothetical protein [Eubacteriales bacterium]